MKKNSTNKINRNKMSTIIVIFIIVIIVIVFAVSGKSSNSTENKSYSSTGNSLHLEDKKNEIEEEMINISVQGLVSIEMSDDEKRDVFYQSLEFFYKNFPYDNSKYLEEIATRAYRYEIENFTNDENLRLRISERYQLFLTCSKVKKLEDYGFTDLMIFSNYYRNNFNAESPDFQKNEIRKNFVKIATECLVSIEISEDEKENVFNNVIDNIRKFFPEKITQTLEEIAKSSFEFQLENYDKEELNDLIKVRYNKFIKAKRPLVFDDYGFSEIRKFSDIYRSKV